MRLSPIVVLLIAFAGTNQTACTNSEYEHLDTAKAAVDNFNIQRPYLDSAIKAMTRKFYEANGYHIHWLRSNGPHPRFKALAGEIQYADEHGLGAGESGFDLLESEVESFYQLSEHNQSKIALLDMKITATYFIFTTLLQDGRIPLPGKGKWIWKKEKGNKDLVALLLQSESAAKLRRSIRSLHPSDPQYERLAEKLEYFKSIAGPELPRIKWSGDISPGQSSQAIPLVRKKLFTYQGDSFNNTDDSTYYDDQLSIAVAEFQERHGLKPNGVIDRETLAQLNVSLSDRIATVELNLERLRWYPRIDPQQDHMLINIPECALIVYDEGEPVLRMKVIVGTDSTPTPVFQDTLKYIVFSPTWTVPKSILRREFLPVLQQDPGHYKQKGFVFYKDGVEIDPELEAWDETIDVREYQVVQEPGEVNALGSIKFILPNDFRIYLHDTPSVRLFRRNERALSHGCVRLEQPVELAEYLLHGQESWDTNAIREAMEVRQPQAVSLSKPLPVYLAYRTAWVDDDGRINFRSDIYGHDQRHLAQLRRSKAIAFKH